MTPKLLELRKHFQTRGFDIKLVGGYVRDTLLGKTPKDVDLCTDATPEEQESIYIENNVHHIATGLQHGTWTIVLDTQTYEITSLRTETNHDGRHATVAWTRDWLEDLSRRDLTINAIAMSFDGELLDPFNGKKDLESKRVRFVGDAAERMKEDYLRILRFFRFHARFGLIESVSKGGNPLYDKKAIEAVQLCAPGLTNISRERVWSEVSRIVSGPIGYMILQDMISYDVASFIDLPIKNLATLRVAHANTRDPASLMASYLHNKEDVEQLAEKWRWSKDERKQAVYIAEHLDKPVLSLKDAKMKVAVNKDKKYWVAEVLRVDNDVESANELLEWSAPKFPVTGTDLFGIGYTSDTTMGIVLHDLRIMWGLSNYRMTKEELLATVPSDNSNDIQ